MSHTNGGARSGAQGGALRKRLRQLLLPFSVVEKLPVGIQYMLAEMPPEAQEAFWDEYRRRARVLGVAYFRWLLFGSHYAYLQQWWRQWLHWLTVGGIFVWWLSDLVRLPRLVEERNRDIALEVLRLIRLMGW
ncbi:hypothetical protein HRbin21_01417 [bacterium HR21]|nr:hypothetical protein HRbin21_01417 [bacterium HR21]